MEEAGGGVLGSNLMEMDDEIYHWHAGVYVERESASDRPRKMLKIVSNRESQQLNEQ